jgi:hypothetical protein
LSGVKYVKQCKVCNSKFRNLIEELSTQGMSPQKVYDYLQSLTDPTEQEVVKREDINPSAIRRHMDRHFDLNDGAKIKVAETKSRIDQSRDSYKNGVAIIVDKVQSLSHMIEMAMIKMEEVDQIGKPKEQHTLTIAYMNSIRGLIESLAKLTGDLKQEGTIDINFFSNEINLFAEIVLSTIRTIDQNLKLKDENGNDLRVEYLFAEEFKKQWDSYQLRQSKILAGELSPDDGATLRNVNTFNEGT